MPPRSVIYCMGAGIVQLLARQECAGAWCRMRLALTSVCVLCGGLQRKDRVFVTIKVKDCKDADVRLFAEGRLSFKGTAGEKNFALELDLFGKIKPDDSTINVQPSAIAITLVRDEVGDHWPRLPKDTSKNNRIGLDHSLYIDQDDEEEQQQQKDLQRLKDELDSVGKKSEEEAAEDEIAAMMTQAYQVLLYAVVTCGWLFVLLGGAVTYLIGGDSWSAVGEIALFLQLGGWVRPFFAATSRLSPHAISGLRRFAME